MRAKEMYEEVFCTDAIRRLAFLITRSESAANDVTQDVVVRVLSRGGFDSNRGSFEGWLQVVTRHTAIDWVRRESAHQRRLVEVGAIHGASAPVVEEIVADRMEAAGVRDALKQLPECEREAVMLAFFDGLTYRQVAARVGVAEGTIKSRIRRGLTRLAYIIGSGVPAFDAVAAG